MLKLRDQSLVTGGGGGWWCYKMGKLQARNLLRSSLKTG